MMDNSSVSYKRQEEDPGISTWQMQTASVFHLCFVLKLTLFCTNTELTYLMTPLSTRNNSGVNHEHFHRTAGLLRRKECSSGVFRSLRIVAILGNAIPWLN